MAIVTNRRVAKQGFPSLRWGFRLFCGFLTTRAGWRLAVQGYRAAATRALVDSGAVFMILPQQHMAVQLGFDLTESVAA